MLEYGNITAFCHWYKKYYEIDFESKLAAYASFGFDASMMDIYGALANGAELHIIPEETVLTLSHLTIILNQMVLHTPL